MNRIWLELEKPENDTHAETICKQASLLLHKLGSSKDSEFFWNQSKKLYCYGGDYGYTELLDKGIWLNLDRLTK